MVFGFDGALGLFAPIDGVRRRLDVEIEGQYYIVIFLSYKNAIIKRNM